MPSANTSRSTEPNNPFGDADVEWSDEEQLLPNRSKRKVHYVPAPKINGVAHATVGRERESYRSSSGDSDSPVRNGNGHGNGNGRMSVNGSPMVPPKSPSRPDVRPGSTHEDLVQRYYQVSKERDVLKKELQRKSLGPRDLSTIPLRDAVASKTDENVLIEGLNALRYEIRVWSEEYFGGAPRSKRPHLHSSQELFGTLTDNHTAYLKHPRDRPLLIQAYVWSKLQARIFSNLDKGCGYVWAGRLGDRKLRPINDTLRKAVKNEEQAEQYHHWRAMTVNMLVPQVDGKWRPTFDAAPVLKRIQRFCSRIRSRLRPWSTQSLSLGKEQLNTIVSAAVALDLKMKAQAADYRFVTFTGGKAGQLYGYGFYDSEMEDVEEERDYKGTRVELSVAPALERCGNANGHIFEQSLILVKADVSCKKLGRERSRRDRDDKRSGTKKTSFFGSWKKSGKS